MPQINEGCADELELHVVRAHYPPTLHVSELADELLATSNLCSRNLLNVLEQVLSKLF